MTEGQAELGSVSRLWDRRDAIDSLRYCLHLSHGCIAYILDGWSLLSMGDVVLMRVVSLTQSKCGLV